jgi:hypothetical protein
MLTIPTKFVIDSARKLNLVFWQITESGNELARQDEEISLEDSLTILEDTINDLKENARNGDKIKVSMQSQQMTSSGRKKGMNLRSFFIYLKEPEQARNSQGISNLSLVEENIRLKMQMEHENKEREFIKRIEALENQEEEKSGFDKFIEGLDKLTTNPSAQMLLGMMLSGKPIQPQAPVINGVPEQDYSNLLERIEKIDPEFITMLNAIVIAAESEPATYFIYKKQLVKK